MSPDDPRHGTVAGYNRIPCREECCRRAHANYRKRLEWDNLNGRPRIIPALGARRRVQALNRLGWSNAKIAEHAGMHPTNMTRLIHGETMTRALRDRLCETYEALCMKLPTGNAQAIANVRNRAARNGWLPPLAWNDIDDPNERPEVTLDTWDESSVDHVVVLRVLRGERKPRKLTNAEAAEVVRRAVASGMSTTRIEDDLGLKPERYLRIGGAA